MTQKEYDEDWAITLLQEIIDRDNLEDCVSPEAIRHIRTAWRIMIKRRSRERVLRGKPLQLE
jgi:hypothetical protein